MVFTQVVTLLHLILKEAGFISEVPSYDFHPISVLHEITFLESMIMILTGASGCVTDM